MKIFADIKDLKLQFEQQDKNGDSILILRGREQDYSFRRLGHNRYSLIRNNKAHLLHIIVENGIYHVHIDGDYYPVRVEDERSRMLRQLVQKAAAGLGEINIVAPIPGLLKEIRVREEQLIKPGEGLLILEAMKMENEIRSENGGIIKKILVEEGSPVEKDQLLLVIEQSHD